jgi:hypothetical protein
VRVQDPERLGVLDARAGTQPRPDFAWSQDYAHGYASESRAIAARARRDYHQQIEAGRKLWASMGGAA